MRISTSQVFMSNVAGYQKGYAGIVKTQQQIASGVRIQTPADDPVGAARLLQLEQQSAELTQYKGNMTTAKNSLLQEESVLDSVTNVLQRARELSIEAGKGSLSDEDRSSIAAELDQIEEQLLTLMNSKDANGQYLFAGSKSGVQPFVQNADGTYSYQGDQSTLGVQVAGSTRLSTNDSGWTAFENVVNASRTATSAPYTSDSSSGAAVPVKGEEQRLYLTQGLVTDDRSYNKEFREGSPYTLEFTSSTDYTILDKDGLEAATGIIDPTDANGTMISFRGVDFEVNVSLQEGDSETQLNELLTGYKFDLNADRFSTASSSTAASIGAAFVTDASLASARFPAGGVVVEFKGEIVDGETKLTYSIYASPKGAEPLAGGDYPPADPGDGSIVYAGVSLPIKGTPKAGDELTAQLQTQNTQSILDTISQLSAALKQPTTGDTEAQYALKEAIASAISNIDNGSNQVLATQASVGARLNTIETLSVENESLTLTNTSTQSSIRDTDMAEATSRLVLQQTMLEAAQASFVKISQLSLFNKM